MARNTLTQQRFSICVGIDKYDPKTGLSKLDYAEDDAKDVDEVLGCLGFPQENRCLLLGSKATLPNINAALNEFILDRPSENDLVIFYFAGHSVPIIIDSDGEKSEVFLASFDFKHQSHQKPSFRQDHALGMNRLKLGFFESAGSRKRLFMFDSCYSGDFFGPRYRSDQSSDPVQNYIHHMLDNETSGRVALASCLPYQRAREDHELKHGIFTYYLLKALRKEDPHALRNNGALTVGSLFDYLSDSLPRDQRPVLSGVQHDSFVIIDALTQKVSDAEKPGISRSHSLSDTTEKRVVWENRDTVLLRSYFDQCARYDELFIRCRDDDREARIRLMNSGLAYLDMQGQTYLTNDGVLLCCRRDSIPIDTYHVHVKFIQDELREELFGSVLYLYEELYRRLMPLSERKLGSPDIRDERGGEKIFYEYSRIALIEALVNFLIHRDYTLDDFGHIKIYNDRIEFVNPGTSVYSPEELLNSAMPLRPKYKRNPRLIEAMNKARLNQREGGGILRIREEIIKNNTVLPDGQLGLIIRNDEKHDRFILIIYKRMTDSASINGLIAQTETKLDEVSAIRKRDNSLNTSDLLSDALLALEMIPLDAIPLPSTDLSVPTRLTLTSNQYFVGRESELQSLVTVIAKANSTPILPVVVTGLGGIGKTSLVTELVYRYGGYFHGGVFWLNCADHDQVASQIAACTLALGIDPTGMTFDEQVQRVLNAWKSPMPRLLVFDGCEDMTILDQWIPKIGGCRVMVTARSARWPTLTQIRLGLLSPTESRSLLQQLCGRLSNTEADAIAEDLGHLPLALHLAGSYLNTYPHHTVEQYRTNLTIAHRSLKGRGALPSPTRHELDVEVTFLLSFNQLESTNALDALALGMLDGAAWCAPGVPISRDLVLAFVPDGTDADDAVDALRRLQQLGLLDGVDAVVLHRLLSQVVQARLGSPETLAVVEERINTGASHINDGGIPSHMLALEPHLRYVTMRALNRGDARAARLANNLGSFENLRGAYGEAQVLYERALAINEAVLEGEHPDTAGSMNNLAVVLYHQGRYAEAQPLYERALAVREAVLGADHPDTAASLNNLAGVLERQGRYLEAQGLYERALAVREAVLGADHPSTAASVNNLAGVLERQGRYGEAQRLYERALAVREAVLGADHPSTAASVNNLAGVLLNQGRYAEAQPLYERALAINEAVLEGDHPDTAASVNNLAGVLERQGRYGEAQPLYERALATNEAVLGADHPSTAASVNNLAVVLARQGRYAEAQPLYERALMVREAVLGADHPSTAASVNNLAVVLERQGRFLEAQPLYERALAVREAVLGADHPDTAASVNNLAGVLERQGRYGEAQGLYERALAIYEAVLGADHPSTATSVNNLASVLVQQGRYGEAQRLYERALAIYEAVLGADHPSTATSVNNLAEVLERQGRYGEAQRLYERALAIAEQRGDVVAAATSQYFLGQTLLALARPTEGFAQLTNAEQRATAAGMMREAQGIAQIAVVWQAMLPFREDMVRWAAHSRDHTTLAALIQTLCQRVVQAIQLDDATLRSWLAEQLVILRRQSPLPIDGAHAFLGFLQAWLRNDGARMARVEPQLLPPFADRLRQMRAAIEPPGGMTDRIDQWRNGARDATGLEALLEQVCQAVVAALKTDDPAAREQVAAQLDPLATDDALPMEGATHFVQTLQAWLRGDEAQWQRLLPQLSKRWHGTIQAIHHAIQADPDDTPEQRIAKQLQPYLNAAQQAIANGDTTQRIQIAADLTALVERVMDGEAEDSPWMDAAHFLTVLVTLVQGEQPDATQLTPFYQTLLAQMYPTPSIDTRITAWVAGERDEASLAALLDGISQAVVSELQGDDEPAQQALATQLDVLIQRDDLPMDDARIFVQTLQAWLRDDETQWQALLPQLSERFQAVITQMQIAVHPIYRQVMPLLQATADALHRNDPAVTDQLVARLSTMSDHVAAGEPDDSPWMDAARALRATQAILQGEAIDPTGLAEIYQGMLSPLQAIAANREE